jgi:hypothetical protein
MRINKLTSSEREYRGRENEDSRRMGRGEVREAPASSLAREKIGMESELFYIKTWRLC